MTLRTLKEAQRKLREIQTSLDQGTYVAPSNQTVAEFLAFWLDGISGAVSDSSHLRYSQVVSNHLSPGLGATALSALTPFHIRAIYNQWQKAGLSPRTIRLHHAVLHRALESAVDLELLPRNPASVVEPPRGDDYTPHIIGRKEMAVLLDAVKSTPYHGIALLAICTGMRVGELCALRWEEVDIEGKRLSVRLNAVKLPGRLSVSSPKTPGSRRMIDLPDVAVGMLSALPKTSDYVFPNRKGEARSPTVVSRALANIFRSLGLPITAHGLRHSHATMLMELGVSPKVVAERLGHSSPAFTMRVYSHASPSLQREAADKLGENLGLTPDAPEI